MKTYEDLIQFTASEIERVGLRYQAWTAAGTLAEVYGLQAAVVRDDIKYALDVREAARVAAERVQFRMDNEAQRLAYLNSSL